MKIQIESTGKAAEVDGVPCHFWSGVTEQGTQCVVFVHRIAVSCDEDTSEFERELREQAPPQSMDVSGMRQDWG